MHRKSRPLSSNHPRYKTALRLVAELETIVDVRLKEDAGISERETQIVTELVLRGF